MAATDEPAFLEIAGENIAAELAVLVAGPGDVLLVHRDRLLVHREGVGVVEQAPGDEAAWHDQGTVASGSFRFAALDHGLGVLVILGTQLLVASALDIPGSVMLLLNDAYVVHLRWKLQKQ